MQKNQVINLRVAAGEKIAERADALISRIAKDPAYAAYRVSRSSVIRMALAEGLEILEQKYKARR